MNIPQNFADKCCQQFQCHPSDFPETVLWNCLPALRKILARIIWLWKPEFFESDLHLIKEVGNAATIDEVREIIKFHNKQPAARSFIRHRLKVRLSRSKLQALAGKMLGPIKPDQAVGTFPGQELVPSRTGGLQR